MFLFAWKDLCLAHTVLLSRQPSSEPRGRESFLSVGDAQRYDDFAPYKRALTDSRLWCYHCRCYCPAAKGNSLHVSHQNQCWSQECSWRIAATSLFQTSMCRCQFQKARFERTDVGFLPENHGSIRARLPCHQMNVHTTASLHTGLGGQRSCFRGVLLLQNCDFTRPETARRCAKQKKLRSLWKKCSALLAGNSPHSKAFQSPCQNGLNTWKGGARAHYGMPRLLWSGFPQQVCAQNMLNRSHPQLYYNQQLCKRQVKRCVPHAKEQSNPRRVVRPKMDWLTETLKDAYHALGWTKLSAFHGKMV